MMCPFISRLSCVVLAAVAFVLSAPSPAAERLLPNLEFKEGGQTPAGWGLSGGRGRWVNRDVLEIAGDGKSSNDWRCEGVKFSPGGLYVFRMRARQTAGSGGCVISGPAFANRDYASLTGDWLWYGHGFRAPDKPEGTVRVGLWESKATIEVDAVRLAPAIPVHRRAGNLMLGEGEAIRDGRYTFDGTFTHEASNFHRTLLSATAVFNSNRWCLGGDGQVTYRFALPGHRFTSGEVGFNVNLHMAGGCAAEVSKDGRQWRPLTTLRGAGTRNAAVPEDLLPADAIYLRLRSVGVNGSFQVDRITFDGSVSDPPPDGAGQTLLAVTDREDWQNVIESMTLDGDWQAGRIGLLLALRNRQAAPVEAEVRSTLPGFGVRRSPKIPAGGAETVRLEFPPQGQSLEPGRHEVELQAVVPGAGAVQSRVIFNVPEFYRSDYGERLPETSDKAGLWWCDATWKVPRSRSLPAATGAAVRLSAARNDYEAAQVVIRPTQPLRGLTASASALAGPNGAMIPVDSVKILRVHYHSVERPTDNTGVRDWWPDALPPIKKPLQLAADANQPLWVLVHVPEDAKPGDYNGCVTFTAEGWSATAPIRLHVWDFALPRRNHLETAFGFSVDEVFRYHQAKTEADKRNLVDLYFQSFAEHRISPYDPTPLDRIGVKFLPEARPPRAEVDFSQFDRAMREAVDKYHFTGLSLPIQGMGGGTFHERFEPAIGSFGESTPEYQAMFASQVKQLEEHLRQQGWLDMAYIYWFDEPDPKDYAFVRKGMERIKQYAPGLRRMLTEEPNSQLAGAVDIWCPISNNYDHAAAEQRRAAGERFWWYVCTGPKAPYCTLFIDHPATELRVWHWQTWQRKIAGTLIWSANYWTSDTAFPDKPQNPYDDPMGYVTGYGVPRGTRQFWGNGDGRFIYPPEAAAVPGLSGPDPVIEPPVSSIRWEMLREGVEDYEFLSLLRDMLAKRREKLAVDEVRRFESLLEVPPEITRDATTFTKAPAAIYARRQAIAEAIERIGR